MKCAFFGNNNATLERVYSKSHRSRIAAMCDIHPVVVSASNIGAQLADVRDLDVIFATWGMFPLDKAQIAQLPRLKAVFYAAGTVKDFAVPFLECGVTVVSAWAANAVPVAEFTLAQIILANKGYFRNVRDCSNPGTRVNALQGPGNYDESVALLGAGMIGRKVIELLRPFRLKMLVFDPFLSLESARQLGVEKVELEDAFSRGFAVSNHLANVPETRGMLKKHHFESMRENAVFINTGRGATVNEPDLCSVLNKRPDLTALLDVTDPEPPNSDSPFYKLPNVTLSSHIAGSIGNEVWRMAETTIEEFISWRDNKPLHYAVTLDMLKTMA